MKLALHYQKKTASEAQIKDSVKSGNDETEDHVSSGSPASVHSSQQLENTSTE